MRKPNYFARLGVAGLIALSGCSAMNSSKYNAGDDIRVAGGAMQVAGRVGGSTVLSGAGSATGLFGGALGIVLKEQEVRKRNAINAKIYLDNARGELIEEEARLEQRATQEDFRLSELGENYGFVCRGWEDGANGCVKDGRVDPSGREFVNLGRPIYRKDEMITAVKRINGIDGCEAVLYLVYDGPDRPFVKRVEEYPELKEGCFLMHQFRSGELKPGRYAAVWNVSYNHSGSYKPEANSAQIKMNGKTYFQIRKQEIFLVIPERK